jgi:Glycosyl transferase family 2
MRDNNFTEFRNAIAKNQAIEVTIVMPCLDEVDSLPHCIANARDALSQIEDTMGFMGEIVIADNGSTDGSQALAQKLGARVVPVAKRGYGAALIGGCEGAFGRYVLMGDCDGSYDFTDGVAMVAKLHQGHDLCMGSRFAGGIEPGAMPWKNRWIGNPVLTGILNLFFKSGIEDAHCGLRAIRKEAFLQLGLSGSGMEFASEMVIKARLSQLNIAQVPAKLRRDLRDRPPHLRPWRDGWRHLRYLLMLSPTWVFGVPAVGAISIGMIILSVAMLSWVGVISATPFGTSWTLAAGSLVSLGHFALLMAVATHLHGVLRGYRQPRPFLRRFGRYLSLETMLIIGAGTAAIALIGLAAITGYWSTSAFAALPNTLPLVLACTAGVVGTQTMFGGFLLAIIAGHDADFATTTDIQNGS